VLALRALRTLRQILRKYLALCALRALHQAGNRPLGVDNQGVLMNINEANVQ